MKERCDTCIYYAFARDRDGVGACMQSEGTYMDVLGFKVWGASLTLRDHCCKHWKRWNLGGGCRLSPKARAEAVMAARMDGHTLKKIAEEIGTTGKNLAAIIRRGSRYSPFVCAVDRWLFEHGYPRQMKEDRQKVEEDEG